jgi:2-phospho-L-lactate/phosphoenolpyruvate guanylyltransferase
MTTWAIVPVKSFERGKSRLAPQLAPDARHAVSAGLFRRVLHACTACTAIDHVLVASDSGRVIAPSARVSLLIDAAPRPPFALVLDAALAHAHARGATRAIIAMADLPLLEPRDVAELCGALDRAQLVVAPDRARRGVGAVACRLPAPIGMQLGHADSFARTMRAARAREVRVALVHNPRIAHDVDTTADLAGFARTNE